MITMREPRIAHTLQITSSLGLSQNLQLHLFMVRLINAKTVNKLRFLVLYTNVFLSMMLQWTHIKTIVPHFYPLCIFTATIIN